MATIPRQSTAAFRRVQPTLASAASSLGDERSLKDLASAANFSPFHFHRLFTGVAGETPKAYQLRLRLASAGVLLLTTDRSVLDIALSCGFRSHEVFTRAFRRFAGITPRAYRARGFASVIEARTAASHAECVTRIGPCVRLYHLAGRGKTHRSDMAYEIVRKELAAQPVLIVRRRVTRSDIAAAIGEALPHIFQHAQARGLALAGHPFTRYVEVGAGLLTIEPGMRVASPLSSGGAAPADAGGEGTVIEDVLPAGPAAVTVHAGPYETLSDAYAALERWMESTGHRAAGPPWESYITDPAEFPDSKDWRTEVAWPLLHTADPG